MLFAKLGQKASIVIFGIATGCLTALGLVMLGAKDVIQTVLVFVGSAVATFVTMQMAGESITGGKTSTTAKAEPAPTPDKPAE